MLGVFQAVLWNRNYFFTVPVPVQTFEKVAVPVPVPQHCFQVNLFCPVRAEHTCSLLFIFSTCQQPGSEAGIQEDTFDPVEHGAGLRLHAECTIGNAGQSNK
jgi:hypothetical protein